MGDVGLVKFIADELKQRDELLYSFSKKLDDTDYDSTKHMEIGKLYQQFFKALINVAREGNFIKTKDKDLVDYLQKQSTKTLFTVYENLEMAVITINKIFLESLFSSKYRIYKCMYELLYKDSEKFNKQIILILTEMVKRLSTTDINNGKKICMCYANYIEVTKDLREKILLMLPAMKFPMLNIKFFDGDPASVQNLKKFVDGKIEEQKMKTEMPADNNESSGSEYEEVEDDMFREAEQPKPKAKPKPSAHANQGGNVFDFDNPTNNAVNTNFEELFDSDFSKPKRADDNIGSYE